MKQRPLRPSLKPPRRRQALRRGPWRRVPPDDPARARFNAAAAAQGCCASCGRTDGILDPHHVVPAQWLRRERPLFEWDVRGALLVCRGCHDDHENAVKRLPRSCLRPENVELAVELGCLWLIELLYPEAS
jgi:hypothetical protein